MAFGSCKVIENHFADLWCTSVPYRGGGEGGAWTACVCPPPRCDRFYLLWSEDPLQQIEAVIKENFMKQVEKEVTEEEEEEVEESQQMFGTFSV